MGDLTGQTVVITGAGAGIGQALALGFAKQGAHVLALGRSPAGLEETKQRGADAAGRIETHVVDVADAQALDELFAQLVQQRGGIDVLINNAAVYPRAPLAQTPAAEWTGGVATNLNGVAFGCRAAIRNATADRKTLILNVGSFAHLAPEPDSTLYCATKAALGAFTKALAAELAAIGSNVVVNEWVPGIYKTQMSRFIGDEPGVAFDHALEVVRQSRQGPGGRVFLRGGEMLPARSRWSRIKSLLRGGGR